MFVSDTFGIEQRDFDFNAMKLFLDQQTCDGSTSNNNTYFVSPNYPELWSGGS